MKIVNLPMYMYYSQNTVVSGIARHRIPKRHKYGKWLLAALNLTTPLIRPLTVVVSTDKVQK